MESNSSNLTIYEKPRPQWIHDLEDMHANFNSNINKIIVKKLNSFRRSRKMTAS